MKTRLAVKVVRRAQDDHARYKGGTLDRAVLVFCRWCDRIHDRMQGR